MSFKITGLDDLQKELNTLLQKAQKISGTHTINLDELFNDSFMQKYTAFSNIDEFEQHSQFDFSDIESIPKNELNSYVSSVTQFSSWSEMMDKATLLWTQKQLGL